MARLCSEMCSLLNDTVLKKLQLRRIFTAIDLLQEDPEKLVHISNLPYKDVLQLRNTIISNCCAFPRKASDIYEDLVTNSALLTTGIKSLDDILDGGVLTGNIFEICGLSGDGKTQLCLTLGCNIAQHLKQQVYYIDTKRDFSARRIQTMLEARLCCEEEVEVILKRIKVVRVTTICELCTFLHQMKLILPAEQDSTSVVRLVILDSITSLLFSFVGENYNNGLGLLNHVATTIKYLATEYHTAFIVVNLTVRRFEEVTNLPETVDKDDPVFVESSNWESLRPALGKYWLHVPNTRLLIQKLVDESDMTRMITVLKSVNVPLKRTCTVKITNEGVT